MANQEPRVDALTIGTFDTPHLGHARLFRFCESLGSTVVGVNSDEFVEEYKGQRPLFMYEERARLIGGLGLSVVKNETAGADLICHIRPRFLVIGSDWLRKDYLKQIDMSPDELDFIGTSLVYTPYTQGISTTDIKRRVHERISNSNRL